VTGIGSTRPLLGPLLFAALAIGARLPFLITGKIPFDSDEAVQGLMARHVLNGELSAFFWGQAFKGVPEVYAAAGAFALFGSSVVVLKSVTLGFFAAYIAANFVLLEAIASRWIAIAASLLLICAPPALVFWSLDASAEYVLIMLLGTALLLLALERDGTPRSELNGKGRQFAVGLVVGLGLWVHQLFAVYLIPWLIILARRSNWWTRRQFAKPHVATSVLIAIAAVYLSLGLIAFATGGFSFHLGPLTVGARAPQKMARIAAGVAALALLTHFLTVTPRERLRQHVGRFWPLAGGFVVGYLPVLLYSVLIEPARSPARAADLRDMIAAAPDIAGNIVPILAGFKIATTERLAIPLIAAVPGAAALAAYLWCTGRRLTRAFFPLFVVFVPGLFLASGAYLDTQSYRYLIPWYAGLSVAWAAGALALGRGNQLAAFALVAVIAGVHAWQQIEWFQKLRPDTESTALIACLQRKGIRGGLADYWTSYKVTFLTAERIILVPFNGIDRYPRYGEFVRSLSAHEQVLVDPNSLQCP
jgi:hypothetical protein